MEIYKYKFPFQKDNVCLEINQSSWDRKPGDSGREGSKEKNGIGYVLMGNNVVGT